METTDVIICGCGPVGAMLSGYLGRLGVSNVVLEKEAGITTDPRAIALDEDGIRCLQGVGIYDKIYTEIGTCMKKFLFLPGTDPDLSKAPFIQFDYDTTEGGTGHVGFITHKQPFVEANLRKVMESMDACDLRTQCVVDQIFEDEDWVYCQCTDSSGKSRKMRARFLVGADGKTGITRKRYLEPQGVKMERVHNMFYEETWVALNWKLTLPTPQTHPDFPLWAKGYSPEDVYDLFFPTNFRFICNPERPAVAGRFGLDEDRLWRFEYVVKKGEDGMEMANSENLRKIIYPYITHPGSRYGLPEEVRYPEDCIEVLRSRPFMFSARTCNKWALNRVILCGDAAHVFPPFGAQGIASGFRDAISLAWRLTLLCRASSQSLETASKVLTAWYTERKQQLDRSLAATIENGEFVNESSPVKLAARSWYYWAMSLIPSWRHQMRLGQRREGMIRYEYQDGMPFMPELGGGLCLPQVYCKPFGQRKSEIHFTDDIMFRSNTGSLFKICVLLDTVQELGNAEQVLKDIQSVSQGEFGSGDVTYLVQDDNDPSPTSANQQSSAVYKLATGEEFAASPLCICRPQPIGYDPQRLRAELNGKKFVIIRPDRFVFAACADGDELSLAVEKAVAYLRS